MGAVVRFSAGIAATCGLLACNVLAGLNDIGFADPAGGTGGTAGTAGGGGTAGTAGNGGTAGTAGNGGTAGTAGNGGTAGTAGDGGAGGSPTGGYAQAVLADGPVAYWRLGESSVPVAYDSSGSDYHGTYLGSCTLGVAGLQNGDADSAVEFNGSDAIVQVPDVLDFESATAFSVEAWVMLDSFPPPSAEAGIVGKRHQGGIENGWALRVEDDGDLLFTVWHDDIECFAKSTWTVPLSVAVHLAAVFDDGTVGIYIDGVQTGVANGGAAPMDTSEGVVLGFDPSDGFLDGVLDEVAVYDKALSIQQLQAHITAAD